MSDNNIKQEKPTSINDKKINNTNKVAKSSNNSVTQKNIDKGNIPQKLTLEQTLKKDLAQTGKGKQPEQEDQQKKTIQQENEIQQAKIIQQENEIQYERAVQQETADSDVANNENNNNEYYFNDIVETEIIEETNELFSNNNIYDEIIDNENFLEDTAALINSSIEVDQLEVNEINTSFIEPIATVNIDTTPPDQPTMAITDSDGENFTNETAIGTTALTISGTAEAGATVNLYVNGSDTPVEMNPAITANNDGNYSFDYTASDGENQVFTVKAVDALGNESVGSTSQTFTIDTTPPDQPTMAITDSDGENFTNETAIGTTALTISGTAEAGATVNLYVNGSDTPVEMNPAITANNDGNYSFDYTASDGENQVFTVKAVDALGNESVGSTSQTFTIDTTPPDQPTMAITDSDGENFTNETAIGTTALTISGTAEAGATVNLYVNGSDTPVEMNPAITANNDGNYSFDYTASDGENQVFTVKAVDALGNESVGSTSQTFTIDTTPPDQPTMAITDSDGENFTNETAIGTTALTISGTAEAGATVNLYVNGSDTPVEMNPAITANNDGNYSFDYTASDGENQVFTVKAVDALGNESVGSTSQTFTIDTTPPDQPTMAITDSDGENFTNETAIGTTALTISGTAEAGATVNLYVNGSDTPVEMNPAITANNDGNYSFDYTASDGENQVFTVKAVDALGNESVGSTSQTFTIDTTPPDQPTMAITDSDGENFTNETAIGTTALTISGTAEAGATVNLYVNGSDTPVEMNPAITANNDGNYSFDYTASDGENQVFTVKAVDALGNESVGSTSQTFTIDTTPPDQPTMAITDSDGENFTNETAIGTTALTISGTAEAGATVNLYVNGSDTPVEMNPAITANNDGNYSFDYTASDGENQVFTVKAVDALGNESVGSTSQTFTIDTTPPDQPTMAITDSDGENFTNETAIGTTALTISGTAEAGATVNLYVNGSDTPVEMNPAITANNDGNYSFDYTASDGENQVFTVKAVDALGNESVGSTSQTFTIDTTPPDQPTMAITDSDGENFTNETAIGTTALTISGTAEAGATVNLYVNGSDTPVEMNPAITANNDGNYSFDYTASDGENQVFTVKAVDALGNESVGSTSQTFTIDTTPPDQPTMAITDSDGENFTNETAIGTTALTISGTAEAGATVNLYVNGSDTPVEMNPAITANNDGNYSFDYTASDGENQVFTVKAVDALGNESVGSTSQTFTIDTTPPDQPTMAITDSDGENFTNETAIGTTALTISGTAEAGATVNLYVNGSDTPVEMNPAITANNDGNYSFDYTASDGENQVFTVKAVDALGNESVGSTSQTFTIDTTPPDQPTMAITDSDGENFTNETAIGTTALTISGTAEAGATVNLYVNGSDTPVEMNPAITANNDGNYSFDYTASDGENQVFTVKAVDALGNESVGSTSQTFTIDTTPPDQPTMAITDSDGENFTNETAIGTTALTISGTAEAGATVNLYVNGSDTPVEMNPAITANNDGNYSFDYTASDGENQVFTVKAVDALGHESVGSTSQTFTIDTTPPDQPTMAITDSDGENFTNETAIGTTALTISGTAEAGATVNLYVNGSDTPVEMNPAITANNDGNYSFDYTASDGENQVFTVKAVDALGNESVGSTSQTFTIDTTPPDQPTMAITDSDGENFTNETAIGTTALTISGTAEAGATVNLYVNGSDTPVEMNPAITANNDGNYSFDYTASDGENQVFTVKAVDALGNESVGSTSQTFTIDTTPPDQPTMAITDSDGENFTNETAIGTTALTISGTAEAGATVNLYVNGSDTPVEMNPAITANNDGNYSFDYTASDGENQVFTVKAVDALGNESVGSTSQTFTIDTTPPDQPTMAITDSDGENFTNETAIGTTALTISGTAEAGATVNLYVNGSDTPVEMNPAITANNDGNYSFDYTASDGENQVFTVKAVDALGNESVGSTSQTFTIDTTPPDQPTMAITDSDGENFTNETAIGTTALTISGTAEAGATVNLYVNGSDTPVEMNPAITANNDGNYSFDYTASDGENQVFTVKAVDALGNESVGSTSQTFTIDTTPPDQPTMAITDSDGENFTNETAIGTTALTISGTAEAGATVNLYVNGSDTPVEMNPAITANNDGNYSFDYTASDGENQVFTVKAVDALGNESVGSTSQTFTIDTTPPDQPTMAITDSDGENFTNETAIGTTALTISGTAEAGATVNLYVNGSDTPVEMNPAITANNDGNYSFDYTASDGENQVFTVKAVDALGNESVGSTSQTFTIDTTPPDQPTMAITDSDGENFTNETAIGTTALTISGTAEAGATVNLYVNGSDTPVEMNPAITANNDGNYSFDYTASDGENQVFTVKAVDALGNESVGSTSQTFTIDTTPPDQPTMAITDSDGENFTNETAIGTTALTISGTAEAGATVNLYVNGSDTPVEMNPAITANNDGNYSFDYTASDGENQVFTVKAVDALGNESVGSTSQTFTIDTTPPDQPTMAITDSDGENFTNETAIGTTALTISGTAEAGATVNLYVNGSDTPVEMNPAITANNDGNYSFDYTASDGENQVFTVKAVDALGNESVGSTSQTFTIDTTPPDQPTMAITDSDGENFTNETAIGTTALTISGTAEAGATVNLYVNGSDTPVEMNPAITANNDGNYSFDYTASDGENQVFTVKAVDALGNESVGSTSQTFTIDTTPPDQPTMAITDSDGENFTNETAIGTTALTISGTAEAGATVNLYVNGSDTPVEMNPAITANNDGNYSFDYTASDGENQVFTVKAVDALGNESVGSTSQTFTIDTTPPDQPTMAITDSDGENFTNETAIGTTALTISGTAEAGATVNLYVNGSDTPVEMNPAITANNDGNYSFDYTASDGENQVFTVKAVDALGNESVGSTSQTFTIDTTPPDQPTMAITDSDGENFTNETAIGTTALTISGTAEAGATVNLYVNGSDTPVEMNPAITANNDGNYSFDYTASDGENQVFTVKAVDALGNESVGSTSQTFTIDTTPPDQPTMAITDSDGENFTNETAIGTTALTISGTAEAGATVNLYVNGSDTPVEMNPAITANNDGNYSFDYTASDGENQVFTVKAVDALGNESVGSTSQTFTIDTTPPDQPTMAITDSDGENFTNETAIGTTALTISGTAEAGATVNLYVNGSDTPVEMNPAITANNDGNYSFDYTASDGENQVFTVKAVDALGNESVGSTSQTFTIDTTPPDQPTMAITDSDGENFTNETAIGTTALTISGTAEAGATVNLYVNGSDTPVEMNPAITANNDGNYSFDYTASDGENQVFTVKAVDALGNESVGSTSQTFTIDTTPPDQPTMAITDSDGENFTNETAIGTTALTISGTAEAGATVNLYVNGSDTPVEMNPAITANNDGNYSFDYTASDGENQVFTVKAVDALGNESVGSTSQTFTIDTTPPDQPTMAITDSDGENFTNETAIGTTALTISGTAEAGATVNLYVNGSDTPVEMNPAITANNDGNYSFDYTASDGENQVFTVKAVDALGNESVGSTSQTFTIDTTPPDQPTMAITDSDGENFTNETAIGTTALTISGTAEAGATVNLYVNGSDTPVEMNPAITANNDGNYSFDYTASDGENQVFTVKAVDALGNESVGSTSQTFTIDTTPPDQPTMAITDSDGENFTNETAIGTTALTISGTAEAGATVNLYVNGSDTPVEMNPAITANNDGNYSFDYTASDGENQVFTVKAVDALGNESVGSTSQTFTIDTTPPDQPTMAITDSDGENFTNETAIGTTALTISGTAEAGATVNLYVNGSDTPVEMNPAITANNDGNYSFDYTASDGENQVFTVKAVDALGNESVGSTSQTFTIDTTPPDQPTMAITDSDGENFTNETAIGTTALTISGTAEAGATVNLYVNGSDTPVEMNPAITANNDGNYSFDYTASDGENQVFTVKAVDALGNESVGSTSQTFTIDTTPPDQPTMAITDSDGENFTNETAIGTTALTISGTAEAGATVNLYVNGSDTPVEMNPAITANNDGNYSFDYTASDGENQVFTVKAVDALGNESVGSTSQTFTIDTTPPDQPTMAITDSDGENFTNETAIGTTALTISGTAEAGATVNLYVNGSDTPVEMNPAITANNDGNYSFDYTASDGENQVFTVKAVDALGNESVGSTSQTFTIDTTPPDQPTMAITDSDGENFTNETAIGTTALTISGTAEAGATVNLYVNGSDTPVEMNPAITANNDGNYSFDYTASDGENQVFTVKAVDALGNESVGSTSQTFTIDTTPPDQPTMAITDSDGENFTNETAIGTTALTISGTAEAGATVNLYVNGSDTPVEMNPAITANNDGNYSFDYTASDGENQVFTVKAVDALGNESVGSTSQTFTIDTTPPDQPTMAITDSDGENFTNETAIGTTALTISGTAEAGATVNLYVNGSDTPVEMNPAITANNDGNYSFDYTASDGENQVFTVKAVDALGNESVGSTSQTFTIDTTPPDQPTMAITDSDGENFTNETAIGTTALTISGTAEAGATVNLYVNGSDTPVEMNPAITANNDGNYSFDYTASDGENQVFTVKAVDALGNESVGSTSQTFTIDTTPPDQPTMAITDSDGENFTNETAIGTTALTISGTAEAGATVNLYVNGSDTPVEMNPAITANNDGNYSFDYTASDGENQVFTVKAVDALGNESVGSTSQTFTIDTTPPDQPTMAITDSDGENFTNETAIGTTALTISGTAEAGATVNLYVNGSDTPVEMNPAITANNDGNYSFDYTASDGENQVFTVKAVDALGNESVGSTSQTFTIDTTPPDQPTMAITDSDGENFTNETAIGTTALTISGTAEAGATVNLYVNGSDTPVEMNPAITANNDGNYSFDYTASDGENQVFTVKAVDALGNESVGSTSQTFTIDTTPPDQPTMAITDSDGENFTNETAIGTTALTISGTAEAGATVNLYVNGSDTPVEMNPAITANNDGNYSFDYTASDGENQVFTVKAVDALGNESVGSTSQTFTIDTTPPDQPTMAITDSDGENFTNETAIGTTALTISGTAEAGATVNLYVNGSDTPVEMNPAITANNDGNYSFDYTASDGENQVFTVKAVDALGNESVGSTSQTFTIDTTPPDQPTMAITDSDGENFTNETAIGTTALTISGTAEAGATVNLYVNGSDTPVEMNPAITANNDGNYSFDYTASDGENQVFTVKAVDALGNESVGSTSQTFTIDTTPPDQPTMAITDSDGENFTNETAIGTTALTISGTAEAGATVNLYVNGSDTPVEMNPAITANNDGNYSFDYTASDGENQVFTVKAVDALGNESVGSTSQTFTIDTTPPDQPTMAITDSDGENFTNETAIGTTALTISGTAEAGATVNLYVNGSDTPVEMNPAITANNDGNYSFDYTASDGENQVFTVKAVDALGNESVGSTSQTFTIDTTPPDQPTMAITDSDGENFTNETAIGTTALTISGTAEAGATVNLYVNGSDTPVEMNPAITANNDGNYSFDYTASDGENQVFTVKAVDALGNESVGSTSQTFTIDTTPPDQPTMAITDSDGENFTNETAIGTTALTISGTAEAGATVNLYVNGSDTPVEMNPAITANNDGNYSFDYTASDGENQVFTVKAVDALGNESVGSTSQTFTIDTTPPDQPTMAITDSDGENFTNETAIGTTALTISGTAEAGATVNLYVNGSDTPVEMNPAITANNDGNYSFDYTASDGENQVFTVKAVDALGNESVGSTSQTFTIDTTPPDQPTMAITDSDGENFTNETAIGTTALTISGTAEAGATVNLYVNGSDTPVEMNPAITANNDGNYSFDYTASDGENQVFTVKAVDALGNESVGSTSQTFTIDSNATIDLIAMIDPSEDGQVQLGFTNINLDNINDIALTYGNNNSAIFTYDATPGVGWQSSDNSFNLEYIDNILTITGLPAGASVNIASINTNNDYTIALSNNVIQSSDLPLNITLSQDDNDLAIDINNHLPEKGDIITINNTTTLRYDGSSWTTNISGQVVQYNDIEHIITLVDVQYGNYIVNSYNPSSATSITFTDQSIEVIATSAIAITAPDVLFDNNIITPSEINSSYSFTINVTGFSNQVIFILTLNEITYHYPVINGSVNVWLSSDILQSLPNGDNTLTFFVRDINGDTSEVTQTVIVDLTPLTIDITADNLLLANGSTTVVTFTLNQLNTNFTQDSIDVHGGTLSDFSGSGNIYTATFTAAENFKGTTSISIAEGAVTDSRGEPNSIVNLTIDLDEVQPIVQTANLNDTTLNITFSEEVSNFAAEDIILDSGTVISLSTIDNINWTAVISDANASFSISDSYTDLAGNTGTVYSSTVVPEEEINVIPEEEFTVLQEGEFIFTPPALIAEMSNEIQFNYVDGTLDVNNFVISYDSKTSSWTSQQVRLVQEGANIKITTPHVGVDFTWTSGENTGSVTTYYEEQPLSVSSNDSNNEVVFTLVDTDHSFAENDHISYSIGDTVYHDQIAKLDYTTYSDNSLTFNNLSSGDTFTLLSYNGQVFNEGSVITAGTANTIIYDTSAENVIQASTASDTIYGYGGDDTIYGSEGNDIIYGGDGDDIIYGGEGNDTIYGGEGNDTIYGGAGNDILEGGAGDDVFIFQSLESDTINDFVTGDQIRLSDLLSDTSSLQTNDDSEYIVSLSNINVASSNEGNVVINLTQDGVFNHTGSLEISNVAYSDISNDIMQFLNDSIADIQFHTENGA